jgi:hypothetical protein
MAKKHSASCRLCREEKELRRSHVLPAFFRDNSASMYPTGRHGVPQPFTQPIHTHTGKRLARKQHGYWEQRQGMVEPLLCYDCEQKFSAFEDYAKRFFYGTSDPIRLSLPLLSDPVFTADYKKMRLFQLSILWRAAEAKGEFFSAVTLSTKHRERLRQMLVRENPGADHEYFCTMARLVASPAVHELQNRHRISIETGLFAPVAHQFETWQSCTFVMGGIVWGFCITESGVPDILRNSYIKENGQFRLLPMNADPFLINFSQKAVAAGNVTWTDVQQEIAAKTGRV